MPSLMTRPSPARPDPSRPDDGSVTIWIVLASFAMILLVGLAVDLTGQVHAQQHVRSVAAQAVRTGGEQVKAPTAIRGFDPQVDSSQARAAARTYLAASDVSGQVQVVNGTRLTVRTSDTYKTKFLSIIGLNRLKVTGQAEARLVRSSGGVEQ